MWYLLSALLLVGVGWLLFGKRHAPPNYMSDTWINEHKAERDR